MNNFGLKALVLNIKVSFLEGINFSYLTTHCQYSLTLKIENLSALTPLALKIPQFLVCLQQVYKHAR